MWTPNRRFLRSSIMIGASLFVLCVLLIGVLLDVHTARAQSGDLELNLSLTEITKIDGTKRSISESKSAGPGDKLKYSVTVQNTSADNLSVRLEITYNFDYVPALPEPSDQAESEITQGKIIWIDVPISAGQTAVRTFELSIDDRLPHGTNSLNVTAAVFKEGENEAAGASSVEKVSLVGAIIQLDTVEVILGNQDDQAINTINPGDSILVRITYSNQGLGQSQPVSITAEFPKNLVSERVDANEGNIDLSTGKFSLERDPLPAGKSAPAVEFELKLVDEEDFPENTTSFTVVAAVSTEGKQRGKETATASISLVSISVDVSCKLSLDVNEDNKANIDDEYRCDITVRNSGDIKAVGVSVTQTFESDVVSITEYSSIDKQNEIISDGVVMWQNLEVGAEDNLNLWTTGSIISIPEGKESTEVAVTLDKQGSRVDSAQTSITLSKEQTTDAANLVGLLEPKQGEGLITDEGIFVSILKGLMLLLGVVVVAVLLVPLMIFQGKFVKINNLNEAVEYCKEVIGGIVGTTLEYFLLGLILMVVVLLGVQNAIHRDAINSIIGGIVGFIAGRARKK